MKYFRGLCWKFIQLLSGKVQNATSGQLRDLPLSLKYPSKDQNSEITDTQINLESLQVKNDLYQIIPDAIPDAIFYLDKNFRFQYVNQEYAKWRGQSQQEIIGKHFRDLAGKELYESLLPDAKKVLNGETVSGELAIQYPDKKRTLSVLNIPHVNAEKEVDGLISILRDISPQREAEQQLKETNRLLKRQSELLDLYLEFTPSTFAMFDKNMCYLLASKSWKQEYGIENVDVKGKSQYEVFPNMPAHWIEVHKRSLAGSNEHSDGDLFVLEDNTEVWQEWDCRPWYQIDGQVGGIVIWSRIITDKVKVQNALMEKQKELSLAKDAAEAANRAKSEFLANMSHEIRTPLSAILGFSELVVDQSISASERAHFSVAMKRNGEFLANIINDILDLSKIEAGKMKIAKTPVLLSEILADTKALLGLLATEKGIELNILKSDSLPVMIETDPLRLRQILINIVGNAIKFTSKGGVELKIQNQRLMTGQMGLAFIVSDTGMGIDSKSIKNLFTPFTQVDSTLTRKHSGTGLGLVLAKRFAGLLGGDVVLDQTELNKGSVFTITIDSGKVANLQSESQKILLPDVTAVKAQPLAGFWILLAEDMTDNQVLLTHFLRLAGAEVLVVANGRQAIETLERRNFDVVLMDIQMPEMDGFEATEILRKKGYKGKIFALTAHALSEDRDRCLQNGFDDHLIKPVNSKELILKIARLNKAKIH